jgi:thioredoxin-related protein
MSKNILLVVSISLLSFLSQAQGIEFFQGTWKDAMAKAKAEDKLLFVDAYAKWCGPCKAMAKNVFTQAKVGDYFNANFINLKLDMEEVDGVTFGHKYPVKAYPTLMFLDGDGKLVKNVTGGQQADGLIAIGADAIKKIDKSGQFEEKYNAGDRDFDLVYNYVKALNGASKPSLKISNDYLNSNPAITEDQRLKFVLEAAVDSDSKLFDQVIANKAKLIKQEGKELYETKCKAACQVSVQKAIEYEMESLLTETIEKAKKTFPDDADTFGYRASMQYYKSSKNIDKYRSAYKSLAKKTSKEDDDYNYIMKDILSSFKDNKDMISDAIDYSLKLYEKNDTQESLNTYCTFLILNKEVDKAIKVATEAKEKAEKAGGDLSQYDGLLNYLNSKKA